MLLFITGSAGTGKSKILSDIRILVQYCLFLNIEVCATTGTAASLIGGMTIHALFDLYEGMETPFIEPGSLKQ